MFILVHMTWRERERKRQLKCHQLFFSRWNDGVRRHRRLCSVRDSIDNDRAEDEACPGHMLADCMASGLSVMTTTTTTAKQEAKWTEGELIEIAQEGIHQPTSGNEIQTRNPRCEMNDRQRQECETRWSNIQLTREIKASSSTLRRFDQRVFFLAFF